LATSAASEARWDPKEIKWEGGSHGALRTFVVPIAKQEQVVAYALINVSIILAKPEELDQVWLFLPKIRNEIFLYLYELLGVLWTPVATPDHDAIKKKAEEIFKKYVGDIVKSVSIGNIEIHQTVIDGEDDKPFFVPQVGSP